MRMPDRTPPENRHVYNRVVRRNMEVRNLVVGIRSAFDGSQINAIFYRHRSKWGPRRDGLTDNHMMPCQWQSIRANADLDAMSVHRTIVAALHVVFARPDELHRSSSKTLRYRGCFTLDVRVRHCSSPESSTGHLRVKRDLIGFQTKDFSDRRLVESLELRTCPHLRTIAIKPDGCIQRFHRAVSKIWELVFGNYPIGGGDAIHRLLVATGDRDVAGSASKFLILRPQLLTIGTFDSREIPFDFQEVTRLLRRPELVGNNGYRGSFTDRGDLKYICHAGNAPCLLVVDRFRRCAEGWWMRHQRNLHSGQIEV